MKRLVVVAMMMVCCFESSASDVESVKAVQAFRDLSVNLDDQGAAEVLRSLILFPTWKRSSLRPYAMASYCLVLARRGDFGMYRRGTIAFEAEYPGSPLLENVKSVTEQGVCTRCKGSGKFCSVCSGSETCTACKGSGKSALTVKEPQQHTKRTPKKVTSGIGRKGDYMEFAVEHPTYKWLYFPSCTCPSCRSIDGGKYPAKGENYPCSACAGNGKCKSCYGEQAAVIKCSSCRGTGTGETISRDKVVEQMKAVLAEALLVGTNTL